MDLGLYVKLYFSKILLNEFNIAKLLSNLYNSLYFEKLGFSSKSLYFEKSGFSSLYFEKLGFSSKSLYFVNILFFI